MRLLLVIAAAILASCSRPVSTPAAAFAQETTGRIAGAPESCIIARPNENLRVLDSQTLAYGWGRTVYVNHLGAQCPGIEPTSTLIIEAQPGQYCRGDHVRGREMGAVIPGPTCILGDWVPYRRP